VPVVVLGLFDVAKVLVLPVFLGQPRAHVARFDTAKKSAFFRMAGARIDV
jgi:hypothetical protein